jgi:hypothetical protein
LLKNVNLKFDEHMYIGALVMYLTWPLLIVVSYFLIRITLKRFEKNRKAGETGSQV